MIVLFANLRFVGAATSSTTISRLAAKQNRVPSLDSVEPKPPTMKVAFLGFTSVFSFLLSIHSCPHSIAPEFKKGRERKNLQPLISSITGRCCDVGDGSLCSSNKQWLIKTKHAWKKDRVQRKNERSATQALMLKIYNLLMYRSHPIVQVKNIPWYFISDPHSLDCSQLFLNTLSWREVLYRIGEAVCTALKIRRWMFV